MIHSYIEEREGGYWIAGTRISLDSIVYAFLEGQAPESIQRSFPLVTLEQVYGAITYYLAHRDEIDAYLLEIPAGQKLRMILPIAQRRGGTGIELVTVGGKHQAVLGMGVVSE